MLIKLKMSVLVCQALICTALLQISAPATAQANAQANPAAELQPVKTIPSIDVARYLGTWYEIAKFPNWFQRKCLSGTNANYQLKEDGNVKVTNRCKVEGGEMAQAIGTARQIGGATSPKLEVRFAPDWLAILPFVWGDYWVIDLDPQYQLAAVSDPRREYLWILSRTPKVNQKSYDDLLQRLVTQQFDLSQLSLTPQD
ncbi:lipocalin family protein [Polynucleobacter sp. IMCC 29146]|uniref:lipocalin family protein n=1 Tax=Polynucleobacter sp. IMCC 29146 TaxID=2780953 RepID=UPI001F2A2C4D|nr:lipocalin family protein [Polynucleobacter sp. IMCC 29146]MCE7530087.1 lipocalin family protein [Polynucleobacter sp. IMCC 29146]